MPTNIPIQEQRKDFTTDHALLARARRLQVQVEFTGLRGKFRRSVILDTGAPFSVLPYTLWHEKRISWQLLGSQFTTPEGRVDEEALKWLGVPCVFAAVHVALVDEADHPTRLLRMTAKLPRAVIPSHMEQSILLGYSFLADNGLTLSLDPRSRRTVGNLTDVVGFLTLP